MVKKNRDKKLTPALLFCLLCFCSMLIVLVSFSLTKVDLWSKVFWFNPVEPEWYQYSDTGMDFFHSIEYLKGNSPYLQWGTIYPPLANLFFKFLFHMVPAVQKEQWVDDFDSSVLMRRTPDDLRVWMPTMMLFLLFFITVTVLTFVFIINYDHMRFKGCLACTTLFSYGYIYGIERGNIILFSMTTALFFILYYDSPRAWIRELALISLAVSANLKIYPAVFGFLLVYKGKWKETGRTIIYGILLFVLPCMLFDGGLSNIPVFVKNIMQHMGNARMENEGVSFDRFVYSVLILTNRLFGAEIPEWFYLNIVLRINYLIMPACLLCGFFMHKEWQKCLCLTLGQILFSNQGIYSTVFLILPAILFLNRERCITKHNIVPFVGFFLGMAMLPVFNRAGDVFSYTSFRLQCSLLVLFIYMIVKTIRIMRRSNRKKVIAFNRTVT